MTISLTLPCGKTATVVELNGKAQKIITDTIEAMQAKEAPAIDWEDKILAEVVTSLGSRAPRPRDLLDLASGSRKRLMIAARRLTYGDDVEMVWSCGGRRGCGNKNTEMFSLARLVDRPFIPASVRFRASDGTVFTLGWGTGHTEQAFSRGAMKREWGFLDEPLTRVLKVNGDDLGPREIIKLSGRILDEVRAAGRAMVPVFDPEANGETRPTDDDEVSDEDAALAVVDDVVTDPRRMPRAGCPERVWMSCERCGHRNPVAIASQMDFLMRGVQAAAED